MAVVGDTLPHCSGTGTQADPYIFTTAQGFKEAIAVTDCYAEAGTQDLVFDANDGVIGSRLALYCKYLDGKNLTIKNLYVNASNDGLIVMKVHNFDIRNTNFYNMLVMITTSGGSQAKIIQHNQGSGGNGGYFRKCNFTVHYTGTGNSYFGPYIDDSAGSGIYAYTRLVDCTFNINFNINKTSNSQMAIFSGNKVYIDNCTICVSGTVEAQANNGYLYIVNTCIVTNSTFANNQANPLILKESKVQPEVDFANGSSYNYFKMYVNNLYTGNLPTFYFGSYTSQTLVNISRLSNFDSINGSPIKMQETDPSLDTYIYNSTNLAAKGFPVGTTII